MVIQELGSTALNDHRPYSFGPFHLRVDGTLLRNSSVITLPPKELAILRSLLSKAGQIATIADLRKAGWGETHVSTDSLPRCVSSLRARLNPENCISTIYKRGYRFNLPVSLDSAPAYNSHFGVNRRNEFLDGQMHSKSLVSPSVPISDLDSKRTEHSDLAAGPLWTGISEFIHPRSSGLARLAFFPFRVGSDVPKSFGAEIAEDTMLRLSQSRTRLVDILSSSSIFKLADRGLTPLEAGKSLEANLVLTGAVTAHPLHYRIRAEMFRVHDAVQLWVEDFFVPLDLVSIADTHLCQRISSRIRETFSTPTVTSTHSPDLARLTLVEVATVEHEDKHSVIRSKAAIGENGSHVELVRPIRVETHSAYAKEFPKAASSDLSADASVA